MVKSHEIPMFLGDISWDLTGLLAVDFLHTWLQKNLVERTSEVSLQIFKACGRKTLKRKWLDMNYQWDVDRLLGFSWDLYGIHWVKHGFRMGYVYGIAHGIPMQRKMRWDRMDYKYNGRERDIYIYMILYDMIYVFACICIYVCMYIYIIWYMYV